MTPQRILKRLLKTLKRGDLAERAFTYWPPLEAAVLRLIEEIGEVVPSKAGTPLLWVCVERALDAYQEADADNHDREQMHAFLRGLIDPAPEIIACQVFIQRGNRRITWEPFVEPICKWMESHKVEEPEVRHIPYRDINPEQVQLMLASRIIRLSDVSALNGHIESLLRA